mmetsp:Transcript_3683/g.5444  ORF Transcript_3683/g.5444 Transcript_3683/m.5444 type:complete len:425 (-) Transcript_3683:39-1313(-)
MEPTIYKVIENDIFSLICSYLGFSDLINVQYIRKSVYYLMNGQSSHYQAWKEFVMNSVKERVFFHSLCPKGNIFSVNDWKKLAKFIHRSQNECLIAKKQLTNLQANVYSMERGEWISKSPEHIRMLESKSHDKIIDDEEEVEIDNSPNANDIGDQENITKEDDSDEPKDMSKSNLNKLLLSWKNDRKIIGYGIDESSFDHENQRVLCTNSMENTFWSTTGMDTDQSHDWVHYASLIPKQKLQSDSSHIQYSVQYLYMMVIKPFEANWLSHTIFNSKRVALRCFESENSRDDSLFRTPECPVLPLYQYQHYFFKPVLLIHPIDKNRIEKKYHHQHAMIVNREISVIDGNLDMLQQNIPMREQFFNLLDSMREYKEGLEQLRNDVGEYRYKIDFFDRCSVQGNIDDLYYTCYEYCNLHGSGVIFSN